MIWPMNDAECPAFLELYRQAMCGSGWTLDLGVGDGRLLPGQFLDARAGWLGLDLRRRGLQRADKRARQVDFRIALHQGDAQALPYRDGAFSAVVSNGLLHHVAAPHIVLAEALRVLAPGGLALFRDLLPAELHQAPPALAKRLQTLNAMQKHVAALGFERETIRQAGPHWVWIARKPSSRS